MHPESFFESQFLLFKKARVLRQISNNAESRKCCMVSVFRVRKKAILREGDTSSVTTDPGTRAGPTPTDLRVGGPGQ